jgi:hypothetical protein
VIEKNMKNLILLFFVCACTQKYADYDLIRKVDFNKASYERPIPATQVLAVGKDEMKECFNQWLFFSNAEKEKEVRTAELVRVLCPSKDYLVNATFTELWWTTIIFTRACIDIKTLCGDTRKNVPSLR